MIRRLAAALAALALALLLAAPTLAGGWAEVKPDAATTTEPPVEGQPIEIGFTVLQHGVTPASWVSAMVHLTDLSSGERLDVKPVPTGDDGHFSATVTLPHAGYWSWTVDFPELESDRIPTVLAVVAANGAAPSFDPTSVATALERMRSGVRDEVLNVVYPELERFDSHMSLQRAINDRTTAELSAITEERDALAAQVAAAEGGAADPATIAGLVLLAVLAGGAAGFVMSWLGGRSGPRETVVSPMPEPAPRGSTTA